MGAVMSESEWNRRLSFVLQKGVQLWQSIPEIDTDKVLCTSECLTHAQSLRSTLFKPDSQCFTCRPWQAYSLCLTLSLSLSLSLSISLVQICWHDLAFFDPALYETLRQLLVTARAPDAEAQFEALELTFRVGIPEEEGGYEVDLLPDGASIPVTPLVADIYVERLACWHMIDCARKPLQVRSGPTNLWCFVYLSVFLLSQVKCACWTGVVTGLCPCFASLSNFFFLRQAFGQMRATGGCYGAFSCCFWSERLWAQTQVVVQTLCSSLEPLRESHSSRKNTTQPAILCNELGGKPKWLPINLECRDKMCTGVR